VSGAEVLLAEIRAAGADVGLDNGVLRVRVPKGVLTATQRERLVENHVAIIRSPSRPAAGQVGTCPALSRQSLSRLSRSAIATARTRWWPI
jgi:hypothetical protein